MRTLATTLAVVLLVTFAGCLKVGQDPIVGKWQRVGRNDWFEFFPDGTAIIDDGLMTLSGKWQRLEDGRLKVQVLGASVAEVVRVEIHGDDVTFTDYQGEVEHYRRTKRE